MHSEDILLTAFFRDHPGDAARVMERLPAADLAELLSDTQADSAAEVLRRMPSPAAAECIAAMPPERVAAILAEIPIHTIAAMLRQVEQDVRESILARTPEETRERLRVLLRYPENTAGALMDPMTLVLPLDISVGEAMARIRRLSLYVYFYLYVVDRERKLAGVLDIRELLLARSGELLSSVMRNNPSRVRAEASVADIMGHGGWRDFDALPVVDEAGIFLGAIRHRTIRRIDLDVPSQDGTSETLAALAELYWIGTGGILRGLAPAGPAGLEEQKS